MTNIVYSTDKNWQEKCEICNQNIDKCKCQNKSSAPPKSQTAEIRREKKGRAGKTVTTISGLADDLKFLQKELQKHCATGGSIKNRVIEIQGDHRDKVAGFLKIKGFKIKFIGG